MILHLTDLSPEPLQAQIVRQIRAKVLSGELVAGNDLPSIRRFAREHHISVITVQRAYEILERSGLIHSRRGKGFFVSDLTAKTKKAMAIEKLQDDVKPLLDGAVAEGLDGEEIKDAVLKLLEKSESRK
ncbi:MAG: GntR family transcriptional regulator [Candidatus Aminicenantes bacterium]|nr:GntR family transcriptional regulator [Candidatus Aminicenantes bacterium]